MEQQSVAAGVLTDCEAVVSAFRDTNSLRYEDFATVWRAMNMSFIFCGREDDRELCAFIEECLAIAKNLWLSRRSDDQTKMGGFYLVYAFYTKQPVKSPLKVRMTLSDWESCVTFISYVISNEHTDALYIFRSMLRNHAFHLVFLPLELHPRSDLAQPEISRAEFKYEDRLQEYMKDSSFKQFRAYHDRYHDMKTKITTDYFADQPNSLTISDCNIMQQINDLSEACRKNVTSGLTVEDTEEQETNEFVGSRRFQLRNEQFEKRTKSKNTSHHKLHEHVETDCTQSEEPPTKKARSKMGLIWRKTVIKGSDSEDSIEDDES